MALAVTCGCGATYNLKDEFAGRRLKCPKCGGVIEAPGATAGSAATARTPDAGSVPPLPQPPTAALGMPPPPPPPPPPPVPLGYAAPASLAGAPSDDPFARDRFLLRQKLVSISQKYYAWDEQGRTILFIERPAHLLQNLAAMVVAIATGVVLGGGLALGLAMLAEGNDALRVALAIVGGVIGLSVAVVVGVAMSAKRHVTFYADEAKSRPLLEVTQENKWQLPNALYTVRTPQGEVLARFRKNYLFNLIRKRWYVYGPDGQSMLAVAKEDSIILSLLRRFLGDVAWLIRTNFIILQGQSERVIGEFNRKFTILDRYVLDMTADPAHELDRRVAVALGVMLDTGERR